LNRQQLLTALRQYSSPFTEEVAFAAQFMRLLEHPRAYFRDHLPGHLTASAWIVDSSRKWVLLTLHAKLNRWLQPGGHADGDEDIVAVALKEASEETGLKDLTMITEGIFDIDIHPIPARNGFPEHLHYDVRILLQANRDESLTVTGESHALEWVQCENINTLSKGNASMHRMNEKVNRLFTSYKQQTKGDDRNPETIDTDSRN
jgi:8-oxo-dGTP pyrophosphatase MutT (NUDIX family)